jgi:hypothetical protein
VPGLLVQHPHALADARPVLGGPLEDAPRLIEVVAGIEQQLDLQPVSTLLLLEL